MWVSMELTAEDALAAPSSWRWNYGPDLGESTLREAVRDAAVGDLLTAWAPQEKPTAEALCTELTEWIDAAASDDTQWYALSTFDGGEPDGNQLTERPSFINGLRALLEKELAAIETMVFDCTYQWVVVTDDLLAKTLEGGSHRSYRG